MDKKAVLPVVSVALLACCALMLSVIGGIYAYNTFAGSAQPVYAASDKGPEWTVTPIRIEANNDYIVVMMKMKNPIDDPTYAESLQMACYQLRSRGSDGKAELFFVAARTVTYDLRIEWANDKELAFDGKKVRPSEIKKLVDKK